MWPLPTDSHELQLTGDGRCLDHGLSRRPGAPQAWADLGAWCRAHAGARARLWVDGSRQWAWQADPRLPLRDDRALRAAARQQLVHYHGEGAERWPLATWSARQGAGAAALQGLPLESLRTLSQGHAVRWTCIAPAWLAAWVLTAARHPDWAGADQARLAWVEDRSVTLLEGGRGHWHRLRLLSLAQASEDGLDQALASAAWDTGASLRIARSFGFDWSGLRAALRGRRVPHWTLSAPARPWQRPAAALAAGTAAAALGGWIGHEPTPTGSVVTAVERPAAAVPGPDLPASAPAAPDWTARHWLDALDSMQRAPEGVAWLQAEIDPAEGRLTLQGHAADLASAQAAARHLGSRPPWRQASLRQWQSGEGIGRVELAAMATERLPSASTGGTSTTATPPVDLARQAGLQVQALDRDGSGLHLRLQGRYDQLRSWLAAVLPTGAVLQRLQLQRASPTEDRLSLDTQWAWTPPAPAAPEATRLAGGWAAPAPPAPPPPVLAPAPPPPVVTAPPFPYRVIGLLDDDRGRKVLLDGPLRGGAAAAGDVLDGQWQVEQILSTHLALRWLPQALPVSVRLQP